MIRRYLTITGHVQNVFYRDWMQEQATARGVAALIARCGQRSPAGFGQRQTV